MMGRRQGVKGPFGQRAAGLRRGLRCLALAAVALASLLQPSPAGAAREYELKAAFVFNFIKFVDWPAQRLPAGSSTIHVCVAGKEAYRSVLETINGKSVKGKTISVSPYTGAQDLSRCHVLFVSAPESSRLASAIENSRRQGVLTVGETASFARGGGIISFRNENNKIRFDINPQAAEQSGLTISSQLLKLARLVD